jgi:hypothetical protein
MLNIIFERILEKAKRSANGGQFFLIIDFEGKNKTKKT